MKPFEIGMIMGEQRTFFRKGVGEHKGIADALAAPAGIAQAPNGDARVTNARPAAADTRRLLHPACRRFHVRGHWSTSHVEPSHGDHTSRLSRISSSISAGCNW